MNRAWLCWSLLFSACIETVGDRDHDAWLDGSDCAPADPDINPGAYERCDGIDQDCDGLIDEDPVDALRWYRDDDGDGDGDPNTVELACEVPEGPWVSNHDDCNDIDAEVNSHVLWYRDADGDQVGDIEDPGEASCVSPSAGQVRLSGDCDDHDPAVSPAAPEQCNGQDEDCDGEVDEAVLVEGFTDGDGDGAAGTPWSGCPTELPADFAPEGSDCMDDDPTVYPGAPGICDNGIDESCGEGEPSCETATDASDAQLQGSVEGMGLGASIVGLPDLNGDGLPEVVIGATGLYATATSSSPEGGAVIVYGGQSGAVDVMAEGVGRRLYGAAGEDGTGDAVVVGDFDGDSLPDLLVTADFYDLSATTANGKNTGGAWLVLGATLASTTGDLNLRTDADTLIAGDYVGDWLGEGAAPAGDINGDGIDDLLIGANGDYVSTDSNAGAAYVLYGQPGGFPATLAAGTIVSRGLGVELDGPLGPSLRVGDTIRGAVDLDVDGLDDVVVGAWHYQGERGGIYLITDIAGSSSCSLGGLDCFAPTNQQDVFFVDGYADDSLSGYAIDTVRDIFGDGYDGLVVGAPGASPGGLHRAGAVFLLRGRDLDLSGDLSIAPDGVQNELRSRSLLVIEGAGTENWLGNVVAAGGDADGDGAGDLLIGSRITSLDYEGTVWFFRGPFSPDGGVLTTADADAIITGTDVAGGTGDALAFIEAGDQDWVAVGAPAYDAPEPDGDGVTIDAGGVFLFGSGFGL